MSKYVINTWEPENPAFWHDSGNTTANRNLWLSIPALALAFAIWMVWSVVVVNLPAIGFQYSTNQLFWLTALPGLSGATLRIFYSFMVPIFGGRKWTTISTASLLIPALGIGFAVQDVTTGYPTMLVLALLCGFGGGNFASSMANISFFYPKAQKGYALGMNAGLGNLGVSAVQFVVPLVITAGVFGTLGGAPQEVPRTSRSSRFTAAARLKYVRICPSPMHAACNIWSAGRFASRSQPARSTVSGCAWQARVVPATKVVSPATCTSRWHCRRTRYIASAGAICTWICRLLPGKPCLAQSFGFLHWTVTSN
jgi:nitrate/nitrite transporter NarK